jgi:large subunit ribosomal protein L10
LAISRARKEELVAMYEQQLANSNGVMIADYTALSVSRMENLRQRASAQDAQICVIKNTLFDVTLKEQGLESPEGLLTGSTMVAFCHQDVPPVAKLFRDFTKEVEERQFKVKGSLMEGQFLSADQTAALADLPSREVLLSQVLRTINAPATQVAGVVASGIRQILNVVQAYVDKLEEAAGAPAEALA